MAQMLDGRIIATLTVTDDPGWQQHFDRFLEQWTNIVASFSGTLASCHGIGNLYAKFTTPFFSEGDLAFLAKLQNSFDPDGLFLGNKLLPQQGRCLEKTWTASKNDDE